MVMTAKRFAQPYTETELEVETYLNQTTPGLAIPATDGITSGAGVIYRSGIFRSGGLIHTEILLDLTGLSSATTVLDIIGLGANPAHLGQITTVQNGIILAGLMTCLEAPLSLVDLDLYGAVEATGVFEALVTDLDELALLTRGATWALGDAIAFTAIPRPGDYLYLVNGIADTADPFTTGKFLIELFGYDA